MAIPVAVYITVRSSWYIMKFRSFGPEGRCGACAENVTGSARTPLSGSRHLYGYTKHATMDCCPQDAPSVISIPGHL